MKKVIRFLWLFIVFLCCVTPHVWAQTDADKIIGVYYIKDDQSPEEGKVRIYKTAAGNYSGKMIWVKNPKMKDGSMKRDIMNPDPAKRQTPADAIPLLFNFRYSAAKNEWTDGTIYDPVHGKTYKCKMWFSDAKTLKIRGYIGVPAFGRTMTWQKIN